MIWIPWCNCVYLVLYSACCPTLSCSNLLLNIWKNNQKAEEKQVLATSPQHWKYWMQIELCNNKWLWFTDILQEHITITYMHPKKMLINLCEEAHYFCWAQEYCFAWRCTFQTIFSFFLWSLIKHAVMCMFLAPAKFFSHLLICFQLLFMKYDGRLLTHILGHIFYLNL